MTRRPKVLPRPERHDDRAIFTRSRHRRPVPVHRQTGAEPGQLVSVGQHESGGIPDEHFLSLADCILNPPASHTRGLMAFADRAPESRKEEAPSAKIPSEREARFLLHYNQE
jgi:hypothetical protein